MPLLRSLKLWLRRSSSPRNDKESVGCAGTKEKGKEGTSMKVKGIIVLLACLAISRSAFAWWHDSVDYYYDHKVDAMNRLHECEVDALNASPVGSRQRTVFAAILRMGDRSAVVPSDYGISDFEYLDGFDTVMRSSNECWNAITALRRP